MNYQPMNGYPYPPMQQPMQNPYADRLAQLQNFQQAINTPQIQQIQQPINQGLLWVSGEVGAKSYLVAPNSTVLLMDSDALRFYLKSADGTGMPSMKVFEYKEVTNVPQNAPQTPNLDENTLNDKFVTREEYNGLKRQYESIIERLENLSKNEIEHNFKPKRKEVTVDEQSNI